MEIRIWMIIALMPLVMILAFFLKRGQSGEAGTHAPLTPMKIAIKIGVVIVVLAVGAALYVLTSGAEGA